MHFFRLVEFDQILRSGVLYPRWAPDFVFGLGYPVFNFYPSGSLYLAELFRYGFGLGYLDAAKWTFAIGLLGSGVTMYLLARELLPERTAWALGAVLAAVAYVYAPYHLADLYVRGALSEATAYLFLPLVFWADLRLARTRHLRYLLAGAVALALLIYTHHLTAFLFLPYYIGFVLLRAWRQPASRGGLLRAVDCKRTGAQ